MDPIKAAWSLLLVLLIMIFLQSVMIFLACAEWKIASTCDRGSGIKDVTLEVVTAIAILIGARK